MIELAVLLSLYMSRPSEINVSSWVSRQSWELSVPDELQYMLVTYKTGAIELVIHVDDPRALDHRQLHHTLHT